MIKRPALKGRVGMKWWLVTCTTLVLAGVYRETTALNNGVARTPPSETLY